MKKIHVLAAAVAVLGSPVAADAAVFGSLSNFDVVNDTGKPAYGFEIEFDDPNFDHTKITSVFGLNRDFGLPGGPGAVVRYGLPKITDLPGVGVKVTYGGTIGNVFTPFGTYSTPGESCWPLGGGWSTAAPCDHYGVSTLGQPAATKYSWLVESSPGVLSPQAAGVPAVQFAYTPPVPPPNPGQPPVPAAVNAVIVAVAPPDPEHPEYVNPWGQPFWVKRFKTTVDHNIDLGNLLRGDEHQEAAEIEVEWDIFQMAPAGKDGNGKDVKANGLPLGDADKSVIRRYEFYKYLGPVNEEDGEVICEGTCETDPEGLLGGHPNYVGQFVGAQMAGFNLQENMAPIPEPETYALMLAGLGVLGTVVHRRKQRQTRWQFVQ